MKKRILHALEAFARLCKILYRRQLGTKSCSKEFLGTLYNFKLRQLVVKKDALPTIFSFIMERCKRAIEQKQRKTSE